MQPDTPEPPRETALMEKTEFQLTREMELLISAGLVFALLQLPGVLDRWWEVAHLRVGGQSFTAVVTAYEIAKVVTYGLIAAIVTHFILRGFWVALMGLRSVFPGGIDQERITQGPLYRAYYARRVITLDELQLRVDRFAASVFSFFFMFFFLVLALTIWSLLAWGVSALITRLSGRADLSGLVFKVVLGSVVVLQLFVAAVDAMMKKRSVPRGVERAAERVLTVTHYSMLNFLYAPVFMTFSTRLSRRLATGLLVGFMYALMAFFLVDLLVSRGVMGFDSYTYFPRDRTPHRMRATHYDNLRPAGSVAAQPMIQSDIVSGPYLRLFIPYDAREDNERMAKLCPSLAPLRTDGFFFTRGRGRLGEPRAQALLRCFDRIYQIEIDGTPAGDPQFAFYSHPDGDVAGRLGMIDVSALRPGRHLLTVRHTPLPGEEGDDDADEFFIPFWR